MFYTLPKVRTNYGVFNIRFKGPKVWNLVSESLKTFSTAKFKESVKSNFVKDYQLLLVLLAVVLFPKLPLD